MENRTEPLCYLDDLLADVGEAVASGDMTSIAGVALDLAACNSAILEHLEPLKVKLREHARGLCTVPGTARIEGDYGGHVTVTFPSPQLKLSKEADCSWLLDRMGQEQFDAFFDTKVAYKPKGKAPFAKVASSFEGTPELLSDLLDAVQMVEPTPRVGFKSR